MTKIILNDKINVEYKHSWNGGIDLSYFDVSEDVDTSYLEKKIKKVLEEQEKNETEKTEEQVKLCKKKMVSELKNLKKQKCV